MNIPWQADVLGGKFEYKIVEQGSDYSGPVQCAVVRLLCPNSRKALVYVHGFSDYFFQTQMAEEFVAHGYSFYAVDLRKYGRAYREGQRMFEVRDLAEYFPDIQAAIDAAKADGADEIVLMGHSTGGLTASLYMMREPDKLVKALILNSPFLDWNLKGIMRKAVPLVAAIGRIWPKMPVSSNGTIDYVQSLARHLGGEWDFDARWKPDIMPDVDAGWSRAINEGQRAVAKDHIHVPVLLMHSDKSAWPGDGRDAFSKSDGVLDVAKIAAAGRRLGDDITEVTIPDGLHDLVLSRSDVRRRVYHEIFAWLGQRMLLSI